MRGLRGAALFARDAAWVWFRRNGKGYQTRLNKALRDAMIEDIKKSA
jgi:hypothetical protein